MQPIIVLTSTYVNQQLLAKKLAIEYFQNNRIAVTDDNNYSDSESKYQKYLASNIIIEKNYSKKTDFSESLNELYQRYSRSTLLFLGNLNDYSELLQEGMLRILEEPPKNLQIILFAQTQSDILPTILSRSCLLTLDKQIILNHLDNHRLEKVQKLFPTAKDLALELTRKGSVENIIAKIEISKADREDIDFWLWQVLIYVLEIYKTNPLRKVAKIIDNILIAKKLNRDNLQKKFVLGYLSI